MLRLRAIEYHVPAVYASLEGRAAIVSPDGRVLAESDRFAKSGVLSYRAEAGARDETSEHEKSVAVLYSKSTSWLRPDCPPGRCAYYTLEDFRCPEHPLETVVRAGHGPPPEYAGQSADAIASAAACFHPLLVVVDTCFGAAAPLLSSLAARLDAWVVAAPFFVPGRGFRYEAAFFSNGKAQVRAGAVHTILPRPLLRLHLDAALISAAEARVAAKPEDALRARLWSWIPTLVTEELANLRRTRLSLRSASLTMPE